MTCEDCGGSGQVVRFNGGHYTYSDERVISPGRAVAFCECRAGKALVIANVTAANGRLHARNQVLWEIDCRQTVIIEDLLGYLARYAPQERDYFAGRWRALRAECREWRAQLELVRQAGDSELPPEVPT